MLDFTTILNRGIRRYIDKNIKKRAFGRCEGCKKPTMLIVYVDPTDKDMSWELCEFCYTELLNSEDDEFK
jgi:hypothetical protein